MRLVWVLVSSLTCAVSALVAGLWVGIVPLMRQQDDSTLLADRSLAGDAERTRSALAALCAHDARIERLALEIAAAWKAEGQREELEAMSGQASRLASEVERVLSGEIALYLYSDQLDRLTPERDHANVYDWRERLRELQAARARRVASSVSRDADLVDACARRERGLTLWVSRTKSLSQVLRDSGLKPAAYTASSSRPDASRALQTARGEAFELRPEQHARPNDSPWVPLGLSGVAAALLGALLGFVLTRPRAAVDEAVLATIEQAAARVASGDLSSEIGVRFGGRADQTVRSFDRMTAELREMRAKLADAERAAAWQDMAQRIAHEIKNPLSPIRMALETLRKARDKQLPAFDEIFAESTHAMLEEVQRLERIVREFSEFARLPKARPGAMTLGALVQETARLYTPDDVALELELPAEERMIHADREQLTQVLVNLIANGVHAARLRPAPRLAVRVEQTGEATTLAVEDSGAGVAADARARIFEPYVTTKAEGTGLGLAIARRIVADHGGTIGVEASAELGGARFVVRLPA